MVVATKLKKWAFFASKICFFLSQQVTVSYKNMFEPK